MRSESYSFDVLFKKIFNSFSTQDLSEGCELGAPQLLFATLRAV